MPLPVLNSTGDPTDADLVRLFYRTELRWCGHLGETTTLDVGTALHNARVPQVWDANCIFDAFVPPGLTPPQVVAQVGEHYRSVGTRCASWALSPAVPEAQTAPLAEHLRATGHRRFECDILHTPQPRELPAVTPPDVKIIPARASFRHLQELLEESTVALNAPGLAKAQLDHYDDPHYDALLALRAGKAVAHIGVLAVGDIGRIDDVFVSEPFRRLGFGRLMMSRAMEICHRSLFRQIMLSCAPDNAPAQALYAQYGMRRIGAFTAWRAPWTPVTP